MKCKIEYIGKNRNGTKKYWCTTHYSLASDKKGNALKECLCDYKNLYDNIIDLENITIDSITLLYNLHKSLKPTIYINDKEFNGIIKYHNTLFSYKDLSGLMLSKLDNVELETVCCHHCKSLHTDNGSFAYTPHKTHLCLHCGHYFRVKDANIGNELDLILKHPPIIKLENSVVTISNDIIILYEVMTGMFSINGTNANKISINTKVITITDYLNEKLKSEY